MKSRCIAVIFAVILLVAAAGANAADVVLSVTGAPTTIKQGETKSFTVNVSATGNLNINQTNIPNPGTVTVNTSYTANDGSATPDATSIFAAPTTIAAGCNPQPPSNTTCKNAQPVSGGPYAITASVMAPANLPIGIYTITVVASGTNGLSLGSMPSFDIEVQLAGYAPTVTITIPENGGIYKVNQPITASVDIDSGSLPITSYEASLDGNPVTLVYNLVNDDFEASLVLSTPGSNTFYVKACNSAGCGDATSNFTVKYDFGGWLPPITTSKFQAGRTLPVKFTVNDYYGPTPYAIAIVKLDGNAQGQANVLYDSYGMPYYQLEIKLSVAAGPHSVGVSLDDGVTSVVFPITVK